MTEEDKKKFVIKIDKDVKKILSKGESAEDILIFFADSMDEIFKNIISNTSKESLNNYCNNYDGFFTLMKILENLALVTSKMSKEEKESFIQMTPYEEKITDIQHILTSSIQELVALCKDGTISDDKSLFVFLTF